MSQLTAEQQADYNSILEYIGNGKDTNEINERINYYMSTGELQMFIDLGVDFEKDKGDIYLARYWNIMAHIQNGKTANAIQERMDYFRGTGELDMYASWGAENDLASLKNDCYQNMIKDLESVPPEKLQESIDFYTYTGQRAIFASWGMDVETDLESIKSKDAGDITAGLGMRFAADAADTVKDFALGAYQGGKEMMRTDQEVQKMFTGPGSHGNPHWDSGKLKPEYTQNDVQFALDQHSKATEGFFKETLEPVAMAAGITFAPEAAIPAILSSQAIEGYQNTEGTVGDKLVGGLKAVTIGPLEQAYDQYTSGELGREFDAHPARTTARVAGAAAQPLLFMQGIHPLSKAGMTTMGKAGEIAKKTLRDADLGLTPEEALPGGGMLKDFVFENAETAAADNYLLAGRKFTPELYAGKSNVKVGDQYAQKAMVDTTVAKEYGPGYTGKNSVILGRELERVGLNSPGEYYEAHHLIPIGKKYFDPELVELVENMHEKCAEAGFALNSPANGLWLPGRNADGSIYPETARVHSGGNTATYVRAVAKEVLDKKVVTADDIAYQVHKIRQRVLSGELGINRAGPEHALGGSLTRNVVFGLAAGQLNNAYNREEPRPLPAEESHLNMTAEQPAGKTEGMGAQPDIHEVAMLIRRQEEETASLQKERERWQGRPLTREEAEQQAVSDYTKGESALLKAENKALDDELAGIVAHKEQLEKLAETFGVCKYLPDFVIRRLDQLKAGDVRYYEEESAKLQEQCKDYNKRNDAYNTKMLAMQERLQTPEARAAIEETAGQYMADDLERLAKLENFATRIEALQKVTAQNIAQAAGLFVNRGSSTPEQSAAAWRRIAAIMDVEPWPDWQGAEKLRLSAEREYRLQAKAIIEREGCWPGPTADTEIAVKMYALGYSRAGVAQGISLASPETAGVTAAGQGYEYGSGITAQAGVIDHVPVPPGPGLRL